MAHPYRRRFEHEGSNVEKRQVKVVAVPSQPVLVAVEAVPAPAVYEKPIRRWPPMVSEDHRNDERSKRIARLEIRSLGRRVSPYQPAAPLAQELDQRPASKLTFAELIEKKWVCVVITVPQRNMVTVRLVSPDEHLQETRQVSLRELPEGTVIPSGEPRFNNGREVLGLRKK